MLDRITFHEDTNVIAMCSIKHKYLRSQFAWIVMARLF